MSEAPSARAEIDLGTYVRRVLARWWLVPIGIAIGVAIGLLQGGGSGKASYEARATIYVGQPLNYSGNPVAGTVNANPSLVATLARQAELQDAAAAAAGLRPGALAGHVSTQVVASSVGAGQRGTSAPLYTVIVRGPWGALPAQRAAEAMASALAARTSTYQVDKQRLLQGQVAALTKRLGQTRADIDAAQAQLRALSKPASPALQAPLVAIVASLGQLEYQLTDQRDQAKVNLALVRDVERSQVTTHAVGRRISGRSQSSSLVVAAIAGLVLGVLLALLSTLVVPLRTPPRRPADDVVRR